MKIFIIDIYKYCLRKIRAKALARYYNENMHFAWYFEYVFRMPIFRPIKVCVDFFDVLLAKLFESATHIQIEVQHFINMARGKEISVEIRSVILKLSEDGLSQVKIASTLGLSRSTVGNILRHIQESGCLEANKRPGQPRKVTQRDVRALTHIVKNNRRSAAKDLTVVWNDATGKDLSISTTKKYLKTSGYGFYKVNSLTK